MPACPNCHEEITKRKDGACPFCETPVELYKGFYYRTDDGNPAEKLMAAWEERVTTWTSKQVGTQVDAFHVSKKTPAYKREMAAAERILADCEGDLALALKTIEVLFTHQKFSYKSYTSLTYMAKDWPVAKLMAQTIMKEESKRQERSQRTLEKIEQEEDIWA